jgi:hypothetical protein
MMQCRIINYKITERRIIQHRIIKGFRTSNEHGQKIQGQTTERRIFQGRTIQGQTTERRIFQGQRQMIKTQRGI